MSGYSSTPITLTGHRLWKKGGCYLLRTVTLSGSHEGRSWHNPFPAGRHAVGENGKIRATIPKGRTCDVAVFSPTHRGETINRLGRIGEPRRGPEEAVVRLWQNADRLASGLVTQDGRRLKVLYPGRRSSTAGPDFQDCVLSTDSGDIVVGDVEVHVTAGGWTAHGHHVDSNYNGVVLHVVLAPTGLSTTTLESRAEAPIAAIGVVSQDEESDAELVLEKAEEIRTSTLQEKLDRAGDDRFRSKADGYVMELEEGDAEQVLYAGIMEALGYSANRKPFAALAAGHTRDAGIGVRSYVLGLAGGRGEIPGRSKGPSTGREDHRAMESFSCKAVQPSAAAYRWGRSPSRPRRE